MLSHNKGRGKRSVTLRNLQKIAAGVLEHRRRHRSHVDGRLGEADTELRQSLVLLLDVLDAKGGTGNSILDQRRLEGLCRRMLVRLQHQLNAIRLIGGDDGQPAVRAEGNVVLELEAEDVAIET